MKLLCLIGGIVFLAKSYSIGQNYLRNPIRLSRNYFDNAQQNHQIVNHFRRRPIERAVERLPHTPNKLHQHVLIDERNNKAIIVPEEQICDSTEGDCSDQIQPLEVNVERDYIVQDDGEYDEKLDQQQILSPVLNDENYLMSPGYENQIVVMQPANIHPPIQPIKTIYQNVNEQILPPSPPKSHIMIDETNQIPIVCYHQQPIKKNFKSYSRSVQPIIKQQNQQIIDLNSAKNY